jgi:uroporphyrin-III C-methyltransferase
MNVGTVYLVGAGPGDPELMTLRAMRLLQIADTVIHDRLIPHEVLTWSRPDAKLIDVGKYPDHHRISQSEINELLVLHALRGETVVRLKGGDPFVFGRGHEERVACQAAGIRCEIVPGISSCIAAASAVGIPVTTRGVARSFAVVTGQTDPNLDNEIDFAALAGIEAS